MMASDESSSINSYSDDADDDNTYYGEEGEDRQEEGGDDREQQEEGEEGDDRRGRHLIKGMAWHPAITSFWEKGMLNLTTNNWHSLGKGYLSIGDIYYLILAAPCFLDFFPTLLLRECFHAFEERHPWVCHICLLRFRYDTEACRHHSEVHGKSSQQNSNDNLETGGDGDEDIEGEAEGTGYDIDPFSDNGNHTIVSCYSRYVSTDYDMSIFWCPLCQGVGHFKFINWCYHILVNHVRYLSACPCDHCIASPLKTYGWRDFLHGEDNTLVIAEEKPIQDYGCWIRPLFVKKKCPADPSCSTTFDEHQPMSCNRSIEPLILHLIVDHGW